MTYQDNIFFQINRLNRVLTRNVNKVFQSEGLEASSFFILCSLAEFPCYGLAALARKFGMERTSLSRGMHFLVKNGYSKTQNSLDKRCTTFSITTAGQKIVDKYLPLINNLHQETINNGLTVVYEKLKGSKAWNN